MSEGGWLTLFGFLAAAVPTVLLFISTRKKDRQDTKDKSVEALYKTIDVLQEELTRVRALLAEKNGATKTSHAPASRGVHKSS